MEKIRISSLAKELGVKSNLLIDKCQEKGLTHIAHHANTLLPEQAEMIKQLLKPSTSPQKKKEEPKAKEVTTATRTTEQKKDEKATQPTDNVVKVIQPSAKVGIPPQ